MKMHRIDSTKTFWYATLEEEVNMERPEGIVQPGDGEKVMR